MTDTKTQPTTPLTESLPQDSFASPVLPKPVSSSSRKSSFFLGAFFNEADIETNRPVLSVSPKKYTSPVSPLVAIEEDEFEDHVTLPSVGAWLILFYSVFCSAMVPCWLISDVKAEAFTRIAWRYLMGVFLCIPFLVHQQKTLPQGVQSKHSLTKTLTLQNLRLIYLRSFNLTLWFFFFIMSIKFTSFNHAIHLAMMVAFVMSINRELNGKATHEIERAGVGLILFGMLFVFYNSLTLPYEDEPLKTQRYLGIHPWMRFLCGDLLALIGAAVFSISELHTTRADVPRFTLFTFYNLFMAFNLALFGYFFGPNQISFDSHRGIFGLFTVQNFVSVFYVAILQGIGLMFSNVFIIQIFPETIIATASLFQPLLTSWIIHWLDIENIPPGLTFVGLCLMIPGLLLIVVGQGIVHNKSQHINFQLYRHPSQEG